jgi:hypothetical protein
MSILFWLLVLAVIEGGIIAGVSFDVALVKLPTRKRIGPMAYAQFARGNDLGNGRTVYPLLGITALLLIAVATTLARVKHEPAAVMLPLLVAAILTVVHSLCTAKAAPIMLSLAKTGDEPKVLQQKLDRFAFWHGLRTVFQVAAFIALVWALIAVS